MTLTSVQASDPATAPESCPSLYELFLTSVRRRPQQVFLRAKRGSAVYNVSITYGEVADQVRTIAAALVDLGIARGDRTAIASPNRPEWVMMDLATFAVGAADAPLYPSLTGPQMAYILNDCGARVLAVSNEAMLEKIVAVEDELPNLEHIVCFEPATVRPKRVRYWAWDELMAHGREKLASVSAELDSRRQHASLSDLASIVYTSGTTGEPKGAMLTHGNFVSNALSAVKIFDAGPEDVELSFLPLCHVFERITYYILTRVGCTIAYAESIESVPQNLQEIRPTLMPSVPRLFEKIHARILEGIAQQPRTRQRLFHSALGLGKRYQQLKADGQPVPPWMEIAYKLARKVAFKRIYERTGGNIRYFMSGGAPLRRDIGEFFLACGLKVIEGYGLTETSPIITANRPERLRFGTVGKPIDGVDCRIADDGEIICRGPNVMQGYYNKPAETREAIDEEGWFHTGDIGHFDEEGCLVITDRKKELLVLSNGKKVPPQPHENNLKASHYIEQAMLLGDNRQYVAVLLVPAFAAVQQWASGQGLTLPPPAEWNSHDKVRQLIQGEVDKLNASLARYEQIKQFALLDREFTQDKDELTPTLKLKRKIIKEHFAETIVRIYDSPEPAA